MKPKYIPTTHDEPRKGDKDAIAKTLLTFSDEPLHINTIAELTDLPKETVNSLVWRMASAVTKWPNIRRVADGTYMWDTNLRTRDTRNSHAKSKKAGRKPIVARKPAPAPKPVEAKPVAPIASTWSIVATVDGKHILKHSDGTLWVASRLEV